MRLIRQLTFKSHDPVLASGLYRVSHSQHRLPAEVTLLQGHEFPTCSKCAEGVSFNFLRAVEPDPRFAVTLWSLPEVDDGGEQTLAGSGAA